MSEFRLRDSTSAHRAPSNRLTADDNCPLFFFFFQLESEKLISEDDIKKQALWSVEQEGIVFIDVSLEFFMYLCSYSCIVLYLQDTCIDRNFVLIYMCIYIHMHARTHTHTHICIWVDPRGSSSWT